MNQTNSLWMDENSREATSPALSRSTTALWQMEAERHFYPQFGHESPRKRAKR
ncbi:MAG: hypothetical protein PUK16_01755 [Prevotellaceae bacterium]|nr:hypothetical protein [Prevotellaceae bacterium]